jgi:hypothetical protein
VVRPPSFWDISRVFLKDLPGFLLILHLAPASTVGTRPRASRLPKAMGASGFDQADLEGELDQ